MIRDILFSNFAHCRCKVTQGFSGSLRSRDINIYVRIVPITSNIFLDNKDNIDRVISNSAPETNSKIKQAMPAENMDNNLDLRYCSAYSITE